MFKIAMHAVISCGLLFSLTANAKRLTTENRAKLAEAAIKADRAAAKSVLEEVFVDFSRNSRQAERTADVFLDSPLLRPHAKNLAEAVNKLMNEKADGETRSESESAIRQILKLSSVMAKTLDAGAIQHNLEKHPSGNAAMVVTAVASAMVRVVEMIAKAKEDGTTETLDFRSIEAFTEVFKQLNVTTDLANEKVAGVYLKTLAARLNEATNKNIKKIDDLLEACKL